MARPRRWIVSQASLEQLGAAADNARSTMRAVLLVAVALAWAVGSEAAASFKPNTSMLVNVWTNANDKGFRYPELSSTSNYFVPSLNAKPNFGIAVSGGGYRAVTLALGYVRALHMMGLVQQARYLSSNSGGSWFNAAFSYQDKMPVNEFLGPYVPPQNLTMDALKDVDKGKQGAFANTIADAGIKLNAAAEALGDLVTGSSKGPGAWSNSIGDAYLSGYGLNDDKSAYSCNGTKGPIHQALRKQDVETYYYQAASDTRTDNNVTRPFPIILGSIFSRPENTSRFYPIEFTCMYTGCPAVFPNNTNRNETIGGGFVDNFGFNSAPPNPPPKIPANLRTTLGKVPLDFDAPLKAARAAKAAGRRLRALLQAAAAAAAPATKAPAEPDVIPVGFNSELPLVADINSSFIVPLKIAAGISSSFLAQGLRPEENKALQELTGTEKLDYWNQVDFKGANMPFADGGGVDNLAVTPLLRRKVPVIVACIAGSEPINGDVKIEDWSFGQWDISGLFGATPLNHSAMKNGQVNGMSPQEHNRALQVFPKSDWPAMFKAFKSSSDAGGPAFHLAEHTVLDNPYQAVHGGWKVKILWVINAVQKSWEKQLPDETQGTLAKSRTQKGGLYEKDTDAAKGAPDAGKARDELKMFPYISTFDANYSPELVGLLSQQATWQMLQLEPQLKKLVGGSKVKVSAPRNTGVATTEEDKGAPTKSDSAAQALGGTTRLASWLALAAAAVAGVLAL